MRFEILFFYMFFAIVGCSKQAVDTDYTNFDAAFYNALASSYKVDILAPDLIGSEKPITSPPLTWMELMRFEALDAKKGTRAICLYYLVPMHGEKVNQLGIIKLVQVELEEDCSNKFVRHKTAQIDGIEEFTPYMEIKNRDLSMENYLVKAYTLTFRIKHRNKTFWSEYPLLNVTPKNFTKAGLITMYVGNAHQRGASPVADSAITGIVMLPPQTLYFEKKEPSPIPSGPSKICYAATDSCLVESNDCHQCEWGFFEGVSRRCKNGGVKFCAPVVCGDHGQPACLRGYAYNSGLALDGCYSESVAGFCKPGLKTVCDDNKVLICL